MARKCATLNIANELKRYCDWIGTVGLVASCARLAKIKKEINFSIRDKEMICHMKLLYLKYD